MVLNITLKKLNELTRARMIGIMQENWLDVKLMNPYPERSPNYYRSSAMESEPTRKCALTLMNMLPLTASDWLSGGPFLGHVALSAPLSALVCP